MEPVFELILDLPGRGSRERLRSLHIQLRDAIVDGRLGPGLRLPSSRELAKTYGISRNTVVATYDLLLAEGYVVTRAGGGTFVATTVPRARQREAPSMVDGVERRLSPQWRGVTPTPYDSGVGWTYDFSVGLPDTVQFPFDVWRRLLARALRALSRMPASYAGPQGRSALREAIASHVSFARAVACGADDVVVTSGAQQAFDLLARILVVPGRTVVAMEDPGYPSLRAAFAPVGARIVGVPTDGEGLIVDALPRDAKVIYVTPSHQFPLGATMSMRRRRDLLEFARHRGAVVIEDDYDGEFRSGERPLDALQTLDREQTVFYVGTFSKSLFPALRLGFVVAPPWARAALVAAKQWTDGQSNVQSQDTLASFIAEGHLARHVRRMRGVYGERRAALVRAIDGHLKGRLEVLPSGSGIHVAARLHGRQRSAALAAKGAAAGIAFDTLDRYAISQPAPNGLALGFGLIPADRMEAAMVALSKLMR